MTSAPVRTVLRSAAICIVTGIAGLSTPALAADAASGVIKGYECGDNCYLTITTDAGEELTGLCSASTCDPWNEQAEMPGEMIGRKVKVTVETGKQVDAEGNDMGDFTAFSAIDVAD